VSASTCPTTLTKNANFPAPFAGSGQKSFDASHQVGSRQLQNLGKLEDCGKRWAVFTALQQAYVLGMVPALEGERLLSELLLQPQLTKDTRKSSLLWRTWFVPSWHPQLGVCGTSINTSTKYSIPFKIYYSLGNTSGLYWRERV
jgi:hypothetical protein